MYNNHSNLIIGFHGCDEDVRTKLINNPKEIIKSEKPYDWLGHGMYFWENNYKRAELWAKDKEKRGEIKKASVVGAVISLNKCLDFTDSKYIKIIQTFYPLMVKSFAERGKDLPKNKDIASDKHKDKIIRALDCAVIEFMHDEILKEANKGNQIEVFDSARGVFIEGEPAFPGAGINSKSHIQLCIRNMNCIKGFFIPRSEIPFP